MPGFELYISGLRINCSTNCATTTAPNPSLPLVVTDIPLYFLHLSLSLILSLSLSICLYLTTSLQCPLALPPFIPIYCLYIFDIFSANFLKWPIPDLFFLYFHVFLWSWQWSKCPVQNFANYWIQTADLWGQKWLLYQLSHNHYLLSIFCVYLSVIPFPPEVVRWWSQNSVHEPHNV